MRASQSLALLMWLFVACMPSRRIAVSTDEDWTIGQIAASFRVSGACTNDKWGGSGDPRFVAPSTHPVSADGYLVQQPCGLITVEIETPDFLEEFVQKVCGSQVDGQCAKTYQEMALARMAERYAFGDWARITNRCKAYPIECQTLQTIESWAIESHNEAVETWARAELVREQIRREAEARRRVEAESERRSRLIMGIAAGLQGLLEVTRAPPVFRCTSTTLGTTTTTTCR